MAGGEGPRLNPLHCGAVVASRAHRSTARDGRRPVSIPFIAGQWSLQRAQREVAARAEASQSPSLRGSGRFSTHLRRGVSPPACLNPLHCGAVVASAPIGADRDLRRGGSQSPSLRGSGRFSAFRPPAMRRGGRLNPLHCGAVVASGPARRAPVARHARLNPLHCGAVVASDWVFDVESSGGASQSPSLRGSGRFEKSRAADAAGDAGLNPLHCGAVVASKKSLTSPENPWVSQSPSLRGSGRFRRRPR